MAGRGGRGRGRGGHMTFNVEAVGIGKGEALPPPTLQPSPLFPPLEYKPVPLQAGEEVEYMLALKQELRGATKTLPYFIKPSAPKKDVERYSDKYQTSGPVDNAIEWSPGECGHLSLATFVLMGPLSKHFKSLKANKGPPGPPSLISSSSQLRSQHAHHVDVQPILEHPHRWGLYDLLGEPIPHPWGPDCQEVLPGIQMEPWLPELCSIGARPAFLCRGGLVSTHLCVTPPHVPVCRQQIPSESPLLQAEETQFPQSHLIRHPLQTGHHPCGPTLH
uniref:Uncharacterized protein n=1 Tax=Varanus komodoensis TaxID=61221 RepID=A0A8D2JAJ4_VARKO